MPMLQDESPAEYSRRMTEEAHAAWHAKHPNFAQVIRGVMPHISQMFTSKYITRNDVESPVIATIRAIQPESVGGRMGQAADTKWIMYFYEAKKGLKLNSTMIKTLAEGFGEHTEAWVGQRVRLYVDPTVQFAGQTVGGVRVQCPRSAHPGAFAGGAPGPHNTPPRQAEGAFGPAPGASRGDAGFSPPAGSGSTFSPTTGEMKPAGAPRSGADAEFDDDIPF